MRFTYKRQDYKIVFEYEHDVYNPGDIVTYAHVMREGGVLHGYCFQDGMAICDPKDRFVREEGRKRALRNISRHSGDPGFNQKMWYAYLHRKELANGKGAIRGAGPDFGLCQMRAAVAIGV